MASGSHGLIVAVFRLIGGCRQGNLNRGHHLDGITQSHGIGKPTHGLLGIAAAFGITGLVLMGFRQKSKPAKTAGLNHR